MNIHPLLKIWGLFLKAGVTEQLVQGGLPASWADSEGAENIHDLEERGSQSTAPHPPTTSMGCSHSADVSLCSCSELQVTCGSEGP